MDNDDKQVGRILTRREVLALLGAAGAGVVASRVKAQPTVDRAVAAFAGGTEWVPACVVTPAQTEGPYFVDEKLNRGAQGSMPQRHDGDWARRDV